VLTEVHQCIVGLTVFGMPVVIGRGFVGEVEYPDNWGRSGTSLVAYSSLNRSLVDSAGRC
jgi:hypothetical protein